MLRVAVFGLGYVGTVSAACLSERGHDVIGVDVADQKVDLINSGQSPVHEARIGELIARSVADKRLRATTDAADAVTNSDLAIICVGTPSGPAGSLHLDHIENVIDDLAAALDARTPRYELVVRSTMLPGTTEQVIIPRLERATGLRAGVDFGISVNPEFLREGSSVSDFFNPPKTVIGSIDPQSAAAVASLYDGLPGPVHRVPIGVAEMTKYADNSFHALKVAFANEIGAICKTVGIDSHQVMDVFVSDTKLNISPAYLKPGFAFGGSCLPKDVRAVVHRAKHLDVETPLLDAILPSNERHIDRVYDAVVARPGRNVGLYGLAFKSGTDDLRESPTVVLAERLLGRGYDLRIYDPQVRMSQIVGANRAYVEARIPHLSRLIGDDADEIASWADTNILVNASSEAVAALGRLAPERPILDLARSSAAAELETRKGYFGVAW
jgi:GDP-mannose 6-dehydrogenase